MVFKGILDCTGQTSFKTILDCTGQTGYYKLCKCCRKPGDKDKQKLLPEDNKR